MLEVKDKIETNQLLKVEAFRKNVRTTKAHKHNNYFELIMLTKGSGFHTIDEEKIEIKTPIVFCIRKDQLHYWDMDSEPEGFVLILRNNFILESNDKALLDCFYQLTEKKSFLLQDSEQLISLFEYLVKECKNTFINEQVIEGVLKALFAKIIQLKKVDKKKNKEVATVTKSNDSYQSFLTLLHHEINAQHNVSYFAEKLGISSQNLNAICRKQGAKSASQLINFFTIKESKRLLRYTNETISEIAFHLGFKDPSHFVKYFKRSVEMTPKAFREQFEEA